jgi:hypothetical protein
MMMMTRYVSFALTGALVVAMCVLALPQAASAQLARGARFSLDVPSLHLQAQVTTQAQYTEGSAQGAYAQPATRSTHPDYGLVIAGAVTLGVGYLTSIVFGVLGDNAILFIPIVGGIIHAPLNGTGGGIALGLSVSAVQIVGLVLLIVGLVANIPDEEPSVASALPRLVPGPGDAGGALRWRF